MQSLKLGPYPSRLDRDRWRWRQSLNKVQLPPTENSYPSTWLAANMRFHKNATNTFSFDWSAIGGKRVFLLIYHQWKKFSCCVLWRQSRLFTKCHQYFFFQPIGNWWQTGIFADLPPIEKFLLLYLMVAKWCFLNLPPISGFFPMSLLVAKLRFRKTPPIGGFWLGEMLVAADRNAKIPPCAPFSRLNMSEIC